MGFEQLRICPLYVRTHARVNADATGLCSFDAFAEEIAAFEERTAMKERNLRWVKRYRARDGEGDGVDLCGGPVVGPLFYIAVLRISFIEVGLANASDPAVPG